MILFYVLLVKISVALIITPSKPMFFFCWFLIFMIGALLSRAIHGKGSENYEGKPEDKEYVATLKAMASITYIFLFLMLFLWPVGAIIISVIICVPFIISAIITIFDINPDYGEKILAGVVLIVQVLSVVIIVFEVRDLNILSDFFGFSRDEQYMYHTVITFWGVVFAVLAVISLDAFLSKNGYSFCASAGLTAFGLFALFFVLFLIWPKFIYSVTLIKGLLIFLGMVLGLVETDSPGGGGGGYEHKRETYTEENESRQRVNTAAAYYAGLKEGRKNSYKKRSTPGVAVDALMAAERAPMLSGYNKEERDAWERGYQHGKWED